MNSTPLNLSDAVLALNPELAGKKLAASLVGQQAIYRLDQVNAEPNFRSDLERRVWREWVPEQNPALALYEPFLLHLVGGGYTPDMVLLMRDGELWIVEVKSDWNAYQSGRSSKRNLQQAARQFAWMGHWFSLMPKTIEAASRKGKTYRKPIAGWELIEFNPAAEKAKESSDDE